MCCHRRFPHSLQCDFHPHFVSFVFFFSFLFFGGRWGGDDSGSRLSSGFGREDKAQKACAAPAVIVHQQGTRRDMRKKTPCAVRSVDYLAPSKFAEIANNAGAGAASLFHLALLLLLSCCGRAVAQSYQYFFAWHPNRALEEGDAHAQKKLLL